MVECKECHQPIAWVKTPTGGNMPVDVPAAFVLLAQTPTGAPLDPDTRLVVVVRGTNVGHTLTAGNDEIVRLYTPHWATCTNPNRFRKG